MIQDRLWEKDKQILDQKREISKKDEIQRETQALKSK